MSTRRPLLAAAALLAVAVVLLPVASLGGPAAVGFLPAWCTAIVLLHASIAALLTGLHRHGGGPRLAVLATAFLWSAIATALLAVALPGVVSLAPAYAGSHGAAWLWLLAQAGPVVLTAIALAPWPESWRRVPEAAGGLVVLVAVGGPGLLLLLAPDTLPALGERVAALVVLGLALVAAAVAAYGVISRARAGLEAWALPALAAWLGAAGLLALGDEPGSVAWWASRSLPVVAAVVVLARIVHQPWRQRRDAVAGVESIEAQMATLVEEQRLREHVAAVVGHDLRQPLAGLLGYQRILVDDGDLDPALIRRMNERSLLLTQRLTLLTEDLLAATTAAQTELSVDPRPLDLAEQLTECAGAFPDLEVQLRCPRAVPVYADPLRLQQILTNLVSNAHRHGADPVSVEVELVGGVSGDGDLVQIRVSDAAEALPPTFLPRAVERYGETARTTGPGLGLAVVHELVRRHGGSVRYDLTTPAFIVTLPSRAPTARDRAGVSARSAG